jgi:threonine/homoserine/homoserine lactone efflux protein
MNLPFFLKGVAVGLSIAAPVGPIGILCIRRSLKDGMVAGFVTGLGAATGDASYGCVAGFGLTAVSGYLVAHRVWIGLGGGIFMCYLGLRTFLSPPAHESNTAVPPGGLLGAWASTFLLTLGNPMTILSFAAVFAAFGLGTSAGIATGGWLVAGVFTGSAAWWLALSAVLGRLRSRMTPGWMQLTNRLSGAVLVAFGLYAITLR